MFAKRIDDYTTRHYENLLKTNAQRQSHSRIPFATMLYSHRAISSSELSRSALFPTPHRFIKEENSLALMIAMRPAVSTFVRPILQSAARTSHNRLYPLSTAGFKWLLNVNSLI
jgi:hypothetical protein